jgi:hypothetical protein
MAIQVSYDSVATGFERLMVLLTGERRYRCFESRPFRAETGCGESPQKEEGNRGGALRNGNWGGLEHLHKYCGAGWYPAADWQSAWPAERNRPGRLPIGRRLTNLPHSNCENALVTRVRKGEERFAADVPPDRRSGEVTRRGSRFPIILLQLVHAEREPVTAS